MRNLQKALSILLLVGAIVAIWVVVSEQRSYLEQQPEQPDTNQQPISESDSEEGLETYRSDALGVSFQYHTGERGVTVQEDIDRTENPDPAYRGSIMLTETADIMTLDERVGGEGPPTVVISVFENSEETTPLSWAEANPLQSNFEMKQGAPEETSLAGADAVRYLVDGLYLIDTVVVKNGSLVYVISGAFLEEQTPIRQQFHLLLSTITFVE